MSKVQKVLFVVAISALLFLAFVFGFMGIVAFDEGLFAGAAVCLFMSAFFTFAMFKIKQSINRRN